MKIKMICGCGLENYELEDILCHFRRHGNYDVSRFQLLKKGLRLLFKSKFKVQW